MAKLHYFNPENDIALAAGVKNFTPPKAAVALRSAGAVLPLWYGDRGDSVLAHGVNAQWYRAIEEQFSTGVRLFNHSSTTQPKPSPWGWSPAVKSVFEREGIDPANLPTDREIEHWRTLSHRRTAAILRNETASLLDFKIAPAAVEIKTVSDLERLLKYQPESIIKSPWSSSGRGLIDTRHLTAPETLRRAEGIMRRQGSIMVEEAYERLVDFAVLFECSEGKCSFAGYSLFNTDNSGNYIGNMLATDERLLEAIGKHYPPERIRLVSEIMRGALERLVAPNYNGPLGIDMLIARLNDGTALLDATVELNLRMTMGFVAHRLHERYIADSSEGNYSVIPVNKTPVSDTMMVEDRKMVSGRINLTPPGGLFSFVAEVHRL